MAPKKATTKKDKPEKVKDEVSKQRLRNFCATLNNYTEECVKSMQVFFNDYCTYGVYGKEVGESGTPHLQIYCELKSQLQLNSIRKVTPAKIANIQPRFSDFPKEAAGYCKKGKTRDEDKPEVGWSLFFDTPADSWDGYEVGKISSPGVRTDLNEIADKIKKGEITVRDLRNENPLSYHQYGRTLQEIENDRLRLVKRCGWMTEALWIHGLPGRGKSHAAFVTELESIGGYHPDRVYDWDLEQQFQCGYDGQEVVIINEYKGPHQISYAVLLKMIDKWPYLVKRKNPLAARQFVSKRIIITSIFKPDEIEWNLASKDDLDQLLTRIKVVEIKGPNRRVSPDAK